MPVEAVSVEVIPFGSTRVLRERFVRKADLKNYGKEGFEGCITDRYRKNIVVEDGFIRRSQKRRIDAAERTRNLIRGALYVYKRQTLLLIEQPFQELSYIMNMVRFHFIKHIFGQLNVGSS